MPVWTLGVALVGLVGGHAGPAAAVLKSVVLRGDPAPVPGFTYRAFRGASVAAVAGPRVVLIARVVGIGGLHGVFLEDPDDGGLTLALQGDPAPSGQSFRRFDRPSINPGGVAAWHAFLTGGREGIFRQGPAVVSLLGDPIPGVTGLLKTFFPPVIITSGHVVFRATISGGDTIGGVTIDEGIFRCGGGDGNCSSGSGTLEALVLRNDPIPDRPGRELCVFAEVAASSFGIAFGAYTKDDCAGGGAAQFGIFRQPFGGAVETVALEGEPAQPLPDPGGTVYGSIDADPPGIEDDGITVFLASTTGLLNTIALYSCDPSVCPASPAVAAVKLGDTDPGGNTFRRLKPPTVSDAGDMVFAATASGPGGRVRALYRRLAGGMLEILAAEGDAVPGANPPAELRRFGPRVSPGGRIAFRGLMRNIVPPANSRRGIFVIE
jgi:hypothetical protein